MDSRGGPGPQGPGLWDRVSLRRSAFIGLRPGTMLNTWQASPPFSFTAAFPTLWGVNSAPERLSDLSKVTRLVSGEAELLNGSLGFGEPVFSAAEFWKDEWGSRRPRDQGTALQGGHV